LLNLEVQVLPSSESLGTSSNNMRPYSPNGSIVNVLSYL
jgi:hypothetical protein